MGLKKIEIKRFVKRWANLVQAENDLDYKKCLFASELRAKFSPGDHGDKEFLKFCTEHLGLKTSQPNELLVRARITEDISDEETFQRLGGSRALKTVLYLPPTQRKRYIAKAKTEHKAIQTVVREATQKTAQPVEPRRNTYQDLCTVLEYLESVAGFLARNGKKMPAPVKEILDRYEVVADTKAAA